MSDVQPEAPNSQPKTLEPGGDVHWQAVAQQAYTSGDAKTPSGPGSSLLQDMSTKPVTEADLQGQSPHDIMIARNLPFAAHGYDFKNPELKQLFGSQDWYKVNPEFKQSDLTSIEQRNVDYLHVYELDHDMNGTRDNFKQNPVADMPDKTGQILPNDQTQLLAPADVANLKDADLLVARNELFARHNYAFKTPELQDHFGKLPWYKPDANSDAANKLSWVEERNVEFIQMTELDRKGQK